MFHKVLETKEDASREPKIKPEIANMLSSIRYKCDKKECAYNNAIALSEVKYDGTKISFENALNNAIAKESLQEYGLHSTVEIVVKSIATLYECESFDQIHEILILHDHNLLIRFANTSTVVSETIVEFEIKKIFKELPEEVKEKDGISTPHENKKEDLKTLMFTQMNKYTEHIKQYVDVSYLMAAGVGVALGVLGFYCMK